MRPICDDARRQQVASLGDLVIPARRGQTYQSVVHTLILHADRGVSGADTEIVKDTWDMVLFGHRGRLSFTAISQPWLRQTAKTWAATDLPGRRGRSGGDKTRHYLSSVALLSDSLRQRPDHGQDPTTLGRADIHAFLARLGWLHSTGRTSRLTRVLACREVRRLLTVARQLGATLPDGPAAGLSDQFAVHRDDIPDEPRHGEPGRDLPAEVIQQICEYLPTLDAAHLRTAVTILIDTGRRPEDVVALPLDCLTRGADGQSVLVYDNHKANRLARRLPIPTATAETIRAQQRRVRDQFPDTPAGDLKLLPTRWHNPDGRRPLTAAGLSRAHRDWITSLPPLLCADDGTEYDKARIIPYGYRHSYAQRHADAGVPIDVLAELLDHRNLNVTRGYYRVGEDRARTAVDKVTTMQFDRHGNRAWQQTSPPTDRHAHYTIGAVAVPYGTCTEPSNVAAGGTDCPLRFRCAGCDHFRTDISYLPDLTAYLDDLLRTKERLATIDTAEQWARAAATPPDEEIRTIRHLIGRIKAGMNDLTSDEKASIDEAVTIVRKHRAVHLGMPQQRRQAR